MSLDASAFWFVTLTWSDKVYLGMGKGHTPLVLKGIVIAASSGCELYVCDGGHIEEDGDRSALSLVMSLAEHTITDRRFIAGVAGH